MAEFRLRAASEENRVSRLPCESISHQNALGRREGLDLDGSATGAWLYNFNIRRNMLRSKLLIEKRTSL